MESLGCVSVICSDKTGTLTQNKMTVQQVYVDGKVIDGKELDLTDQTQRYLLYDAVLTNDSSIVDGKGIGDPQNTLFWRCFVRSRSFRTAILEKWECMRMR